MILRNYDHSYVCGVLDFICMLQQLLEIWGELFG
jgi:hypothetical protein